MTKKSFKSCETRDYLKFLHSDVNSPQLVASYDGKWCFVTFIDNATGMCFICFIHSKEEVFGKFVAITNLLKNQLNRSVLRLMVTSSVSIRTPFFADVPYIRMMQHQWSIEKIYIVHHYIKLFNFLQKCTRTMWYVWHICITNTHPSKIHNSFYRTFVSGEIESGRRVCARAKILA